MEIACSSFVFVIVSIPIAILNLPAGLTIASISSIVFIVNLYIFIEAYYRGTRQPAYSPALSNTHQQARVFNEPGRKNRVLEKRKLIKDICEIQNIVEETLDKLNNSNNELADKFMVLDPLNHDKHEHEQNRSEAPNIKDFNEQINSARKVLSGIISETRSIHYNIEESNNTGRSIGELNEDIRAISICITNMERGAEEFMKKAHFCIELGFDLSEKWYERFGRLECEYKLNNKKVKYGAVDAGTDIPHG